MKVCSKCKKNKEVGDFYGRHRYCKSCLNKRTVLCQRETKLKCLEYKGGKCSVCGYDKCPNALQFHHKDPTKKDFQIAKHHSKNFNKNKKFFIKELDKCDLLCANCHAERHYKDEIEAYEAKETA